VMAMALPEVKGTYVLVAPAPQRKRLGDRFKQQGRERWKQQTSWTKDRCVPSLHFVPRP
jgi:hypothetical protein